MDQYGLDLWGKDLKISANLEQLSYASESFV